MSFPLDPFPRDPRWYTEPLSREEWLSHEADLSPEDPDDESSVARVYHDGPCSPLVRGEGTEPALPAPTPEED